MWHFGALNFSNYSGGTCHIYTQDLLICKPNPLIPTFRVWQLDLVLRLAEIYRGQLQTAENLTGPVCHTL